MEMGRVPPSIYKLTVGIFGAVVGHVLVTLADSRWWQRRWR